jgi:hypothetical protein
MIFRRRGKQGGQPLCLGLKMRRTAGGAFDAAPMALRPIRARNPGFVDGVVVAPRHLDRNGQAVNQSGLYPAKAGRGRAASSTAALLPIPVMHKRRTIT